MKPMQGTKDVQPSIRNNLERDASSADVNADPSLLADQLQQQPMSEEAKKKRRQEINRESARRVRKRKTEAHVQLQEEVQTFSVGNFGFGLIYLQMDICIF